MKTLFKLLSMLALTLSVLGTSVSIALADSPTKSEYPYTVSNILSEACSFPIVVDSIGRVTEIYFFDANGSLTRIYQHTTEQDTFTANGKTLVGIPFTYNINILFDGSGNVTHVLSDGVTEKIPLPDGSLFVSAGRMDFIAHPGATFLISPDKGNPGNVAGFCAALSS